MSSLPAGLVRDYLVRQGHQPAIIDWKYFDAEFNRHGERGFAGIQDGRLVAFLGLIPFTVQQGGRPVNAAWSCDWYKDPDISGPLGLMLIRQSVAAYPVTYSLGGSEMTKAIMGRLARLTVPTAALELYRPLRIGGALQMLGKATGKQLPSWSVVNQIPVPAALGFPGSRSTELLTTLPASLAPRLGPGPGTTGDLPHYDLPYLQWLLERCPAITGGVCLTRSGQQVSAAVLFWRPAHDRRWWRLCLLADRRTADGAGIADLTAALRRTLVHLRHEGGWLVSLLVSHQDRISLTLARRYGFMRSNVHRPFYVLTRDPATVPVEPSVFSYLDTDFAYRFPDFAESDGLGAA